MNVDETSVSETCLVKYGRTMEGYNCLMIMAAIEGHESMGIQQCSLNSHLPEYRHIMNFHSGCDYVEIVYLQYVVPPLMLLCFIGNMLNLLIYGLPYFDGSSSVHFLRAKAVFNMIFMFSRVLDVLHASSPTPINWLEPLFWQTRPYLMWISNISGTMSTWLTLMVTVETVMCITMPFVFRKYCTKRVTWIFLILSLCASTLLHSTHLMTMEVQENFSIRNYTQLHYQHENSTCWYFQSFFRVRNNPTYEFWRRLHMAITTGVSIVIPTIAMLVCTILIIKQFTFKNLGEAFSQRRKCVIRMTVATTLTHLLLEGPATISHSISAYQGEDYTFLMCVINHGNNLLSLVNATIPFFVFLFYNEQFRHMTVMYLKAVIQTDQTKRKAYFSQAGMRCSRMSRIETDRSMAEARLVSRPSHV